MAGGSVSELIIFIAAISVAAAVSGGLVTTVGDISDSLDDRGTDLSSDIATDVEIISDPGSGAVYDPAAGEIKVLVKNIGGRTLAADESGVEVLVDGVYVGPSAFTVTVLDGNAWREGNVVRVTVNESLSVGDHRVTLVVGSERETLRFRA